MRPFRCSDISTAGVPAPPARKRPSKSSRLSSGQLVLCRELRSHVINGYGSRWISFQCVIGGTPLLGEPAIHRASTPPPRAQPVADHFAFRRIFASGDFGFHSVRHLIGQRNAELLGGSHGASWINRIKSYAYFRAGSALTAAAARFALMERLRGTRSLWGVPRLVR